MHSEILTSDSSKLIGYCEDKSISIYDLKSNKIQQKIESGHSETIFDLKYNRNEYGIFATCSHDGTIKVWDMNKNKIIHNLNFDMCLFSHKRIDNKSSAENYFEKNHFISLQWSPLEKHLLITGDSQSYLRLWDIKKEKLLESIRIQSTGKDPKENSIKGIDWDKYDNIIAAGGNLIKLFKYENGKLIQKADLITEYTSPANILQVKFNPFEKLNFAACCQDGIVRLFSERNKKCNAELSSHTKKVYGVTFNPLKKGVFATSSDDCKIGVWDLNKSQKAALLSGHYSNVRQIVWFRDHSNILISGSWDGNIKFWNIDNNACIYTISEHYSDVYGLDICYDHPYLLMSSSRDNSIRFWNMPIMADKMVQVSLILLKIF